MICHYSLASRDGGCALLLQKDTGLGFWAKSVLFLPQKRLPINLAKWSVILLDLYCSLLLEGAFLERYSVAIYPIIFAQNIAP